MKYKNLFACSIVFLPVFLVSCNKDTANQVKTWQIDKEFGSAGTLISGFGKETGWYKVRDIDLLPDGKILLSMWEFNSLTIIKLNKNGSIDTSFANSGKYTEKLFDIPVDTADDVVVQPDGKILFGVNSADSNKPGIKVIRLHSDGTLDTSFGENGESIIGFPNIDELTKLAIDKTGKIYASCIVSEENDALSNIVLRLNANGLLDKSWGNDGAVDQGLRLFSGFVNDIIYRDGALFVADRNRVFKYKYDGSIDHSYGENGQIDLWQGYNSPYQDAISSQSVFINESGLISAGYWRKNDYYYRVGLASFDEKGNRLADFGQNGVVKSELLDNNSLGHEMVIHAKMAKDGNIFVSGEFYNPNFGQGFDDSKSFIASYRQNGQINEDFFGKHGFVMSNVATENGKLDIVTDEAGRDRLCQASVMVNSNGSKGKVVINCYKSTLVTL